jgi:hypothetical protein
LERVADSGGGAGLAATVRAYAAVTVEPHRSGDAHPHSVDGDDGTGVVEHERAGGRDGRGDTCRAGTTAEVVMVTEYRDHRRTQIADLVGEAGGLLGGASLGEVAGQQQDVGMMP